MPSCAIVIPLLAKSSRGDITCFFENGATAEELIVFMPALLEGGMDGATVEGFELLMKPDTRKDVDEVEGRGSSG